jgi:uncharacterized protein (DUF885 family)
MIRAFLPSLVLAIALHQGGRAAAPPPLPVAAAPILPNSPASSSPVAAVIADYDAFERRVDPIEASRDGDRDALSRLPDDSPSALAAEVTAFEGFKARLKAIRGPLDGEDDLNRTFLLRVIGDDLEGLKLDVARINFDAYDGFHLFPTELAEGTQIRDRADADAYLTRLSLLPAFYETEIANARRGVATGFTQPKPTVEVVVAIVAKQVARPAVDDPLLTPLTTLPATIPAAEQARIRDRALMLVAPIKAEQAKLLSFLKTDYLPYARTSLAARDLPNGEAYYRWAVRHHTTTDMTPDEIHDLGTREVKRIREEMEQAIKDAGFKGSFQDFQHFLHTDPQFYVTTREALLEKAAIFNKRVDDALPREFGRLPRLPFAVREIPRESEESATTAYYDAGAPALGVAGGFMVNTSHLDQRPLYELPALALHESEPGHHLQIALSQELTGIPRFRRNAYVTAYVEGWALYSEQIGKEMGMYRTPYEHFGRLSYEMWRACRLVADTGIHWLHWSRDQARACFTDNTALAPKNIEVELDRYIGWPGQALAYKIGELKIMALRRRAETALGPKFDVRAFHDAVLLEGPMPLDLLEQRIDAWIADQKAKG